MVPDIYFHPARTWDLSATTTSWVPDFNANLTAIVKAGFPQSQFVACKPDTVMTSPGTPVVYTLLLAPVLIADYVTSPPAAPGWGCAYTEVLIPPPAP